MLSVKNIWTFAVIVITFVFLPSENWDFWFFGGKAEHYAEICLRSDKHCYIIAKNLLSGPVHLGFQGIISELTTTIGEPKMKEIEPSGSIPANSISFLELRPGPLVGHVTHTLGSDYVFSPKLLRMTVPIEEDRWIFFVLALILAAAALTHSIGGLMREDDRQKGERKISYALQTQK